MTTVWHRDATEWWPTLQDQLGRARHLLGESSAPDAGALDQAEQALRQTSDALLALLVEFGVETPRGWRVHQLRSRLDAHLLAASALADADASEAVLRMLRRSVAMLDPEPESLRLDPRR